ncbi:MAG: hypothetical protein PHN56_02080 [Candidatus Nanoarchaeia archaeon]|nr:hypothetical protein [Candidatus Nanoarchaeia archaeon]
MTIKISNFSKNSENLPSKSLEECLYVDQCAFGYINKNVPRDYISTFGLGPCIGLYLKDSKSELQALAHIDRQHEKSTNIMLNYLKSRDLSKGEYDKVIIFQSHQADEKDVEKITKALNYCGINDIEIIAGEMIFNIIFDKNGKMYKLQTGKEMGNPLSCNGLEILTKDKITCQNHESIKPKSFDEMKKLGFRFETNLGAENYILEFNKESNTLEKIKRDMNKYIMNYSISGVEVVLNEAYDIEGKLLNDYVGIWTKKE